MRNCFLIAYKTAFLLAVWAGYLAPHGAWGQGAAFAIQSVEKSASGLHLRFQGESSSFYRLETSGDLRRWQFLNRQFAMDHGETLLAFSDLQANEAPRRFYRVAKIANQKAQPDRPNILFIMTDDQAPWATAASGHPYAVTSQHEIQKL